MIEYLNAFWRAFMIADISLQIIVIGQLLFVCFGIGMLIYYALKIHRRLKTGIEVFSSNLHAGTPPKLSED